MPFGVKRGNDTNVRKHLASVAATKEDGDTPESAEDAAVLATEEDV